MARWILKKDAEARFHAGQPWVFRNDLLSSTQDVSPGQWVELVNAKGHVLGYGFGHPHAPISFRLVTRSSRPRPPDTDFFRERLRQAAALRDELGVTEASYRLFFSESDGVPGLIVDSYLLADRSRLLAAQVQSAGCDTHRSGLVEALREMAPHLVFRRDATSRKSEGLAVHPPEIFSPRPANDLRACEFLNAGGDRGPIRLLADFVEGQKTGFFLDQNANMLRLMHHLQRTQSRPQRVLDLFCHVGRWGVTIGAFLQSQGLAPMVDFIDSSASALDLAGRNAALNEVPHRLRREDIVATCADWESDTYDLVVCDPPAFVKTRGDKDSGMRAYLKVFRHALRTLRPGGFVALCSCSQNVSESDMTDLVMAASHQSGQGILWIDRGTQGVDHGVRAPMTHALYLKAWFGYRPRGLGA